MKMPTSAGIDRPFPSVPVSDRYLAIGSIEDARNRICRMIERSEGLGVIIGPPGTGKTLLCQRIAAQFRSTHAIVTLGDIRVTSRMGLIQQVLFHLRLPHQGLDEQAMQLSLVESLTKGNDSARSLLLIVDEAQMLSIELLDEIRMLTNLIRDGRSLVQTILVGGPRLEDPLVDPQMESLSQRIVARCYLHPMNQAETSQYVRSMLAITGLPINDDAISSVHHACGGVPRLINQLMNHSLDFAMLHRKKLIDDHCVQHAWADLQQLPSPVIDPKLKPQTAAIEFGELDADFDVPTQSAKASYVDFASILASTTIDCLQEQIDAPDQYEPRKFAAPDIPTPVQLKTTHTTIVPQIKRPDQIVNRDELFGIDFSDEILVDVQLAKAIGNQSKSTATTYWQPLTEHEPATEEISLHSEILQMSQTAQKSLTTRPGIDSRLSTSPANSRAALPWAPPPRIVEETMEPLPRTSVDMPGPMAVVWSDDEPTSDQLDDRDMLVIEDDVTVIVDPPSTGMIGSGSLRQPAVQVDQQYQNLFSRLRSRQ